MYFYYNRAAIGLACAQATAMRIDIAPLARLGGGLEYTAGGGSLH